MQYYAKAQYGQKKAKIRNAMSNSYQPLARPGTHHDRNAINAYKKKFDVCDLFRSNTVFGHTDTEARVLKANGVSRIPLCLVVFY